MAASPVGTVERMVAFPFGSPVAGVSFHQAAVVDCKVGDQVMVVREPDNPYDANAYLVSNTAGDTLGHLPGALAARLVSDGSPDVIEATIEKVLDTNMTVGLRLWLTGSGEAPVAPVSVAAEDERVGVVVVRSTGRVLGALVRVDQDNRAVIVHSETGGEVAYPDALVEISEPAAT